MKYAFINSVKSEAVKGMQGICPSCGSEVIARCGTLKVHHWAHKHKRQCDRWWEPETDWHRSWKGHYPENWQEFVMPDPSTGEKHIADVRIENGLVLEFQHSPIQIDERTARERFYKDMIWIVDGRRSIRDLKRFQKNQFDLKVAGQNMYMTTFPEELFPAQWLDSSVPVVFDFPMDETSTPDDLGSSTLWCLFDFKHDGSSFIGKFTKNLFIKTTINGEWNSVVNNLKLSIQQIEENRRRQIHYYAIPRFVKRRRF